jgi:hypothetical protein
MSCITPHIRLPYGETTARHVAPEQAAHAVSAPEECEQRLSSLLMSSWPQHTLAAVIPLIVTVPHLNLDTAPGILSTIQVRDGFAPDLITHLRGSRSMKSASIFSTSPTMLCTSLQCHPNMWHRCRPHHRLPVALHALCDIKGIPIHNAIVGRDGLGHPANPDLRATEDHQSSSPQCFRHPPHSSSCKDEVNSRTHPLLRLGDRLLAPGYRR